MKASKKQGTEKKPQDLKLSKTRGGIAADVKGGAAKGGGKKKTM